MRTKAPRADWTVSISSSGRTVAPSSIEGGVTRRECAPGVFEFVCVRVCPRACACV